MSFILLGILNSQVEAAGGGAYELIESNILSSSASSVTFSSIPQDYKHLQIRYAFRNTDGSSTASGVWGQLNGVTGSSYYNHYLYGDGSSVASSAFSDTRVYFGEATGDGSGNTSVFGVGVADILDYSSSSKNTTIRTLGGVEKASGFDFIGLHSTLFNNTGAVTSISIFPATAQIKAGSRFSLYGIRGE